MQGQQIATVIWHTYIDNFKNERKHMLTPHELKHAIKNGTITDYTPYLTFPNPKYLKILAEEGAAIEELVKLNQSALLEVLIHNNHATKYWHEWAISGTGPVKRALIEKGYNLEHFIHDKEVNVRWALMNKAHEYIPRVATQSEYDYANAFRILLDIDEVSTENLRTIVDLYERYKSNSTSENEYDAYCLKLEGQEKETNLIEKTMRPIDLFITDNPLWTLHHSVAVINKLKELYQEALTKNKEELFKQHFDELLRPSITRTEMIMAYRKLVEST